MRERFVWLVAGAACALLGCGATKQNQSESAAGSAGTLSAGGTPGVAGASAQAGSAEAGSAGAPGGGSAGAGSAGHSSSGGAPVCVPVPHERPAPGPLTSSFASLVGDFAGIYKIDAVYEYAGDCGSMCLAGSTIDPGAFDFPYLIVVAAAAPRYDVLACKSVDDCTSDTAPRAYLATVDDAKSDQILFGNRSYVQNPQGQTCTGGDDDAWLIATAPKKIRVDVQRIRANFPAYYDDATKLYGCASEDASNAALNQPCNELSVVDATRLE